MAVQLQLRRGTAAENAEFIGAQGELTYATDTKALHIHDGETAGGFSVDTVVAWQAPTADNNYTWYRKYASGWVEQGAQITAPTNRTPIIFPIAFSNANYYFNFNGQWSEEASSHNTGYQDIKTTGCIITTSFAPIPGCWEAKGMAA